MDYNILTINFELWIIIFVASSELSLTNPAPESQTSHTNSGDGRELINEYLHQFMVLNRLDYNTSIKILFHDYLEKYGGAKQTTPSTGNANFRNSSQPTTFPTAAPSVQNEQPFIVRVLDVPQEGAPIPKNMAEKSGAYRLGDPERRKSFSKSGKNKKELERGRSNHRQSTKVNFERPPSEALLPPRHNTRGQIDVSRLGNNLNENSEDEKNRVFGFNHRINDDSMNKGMATAETSNPRYTHNHNRVPITRKLSRILQPPKYEDPRDLRKASSSYGGAIHSRGTQKYRYENDESAPTTLPPPPPVPFVNQRSQTELDRVPLIENNSLSQNQKNHDDTSQSQESRGQFQGEKKRESFNQGQSPGSDQGHENAGPTHQDQFVSTPSNEPPITERDFRSENAPGDNGRVRLIENRYTQDPTLNPPSQFTDYDTASVDSQNIKDESTLAPGIRMEQLMSEEIVRKGMKIKKVGERFNFTFDSTSGSGHQTAGRGEEFRLTQSETNYYGSGLSTPNPTFATSNQNPATTFDVIPGVAGIDYPIYAKPPTSAFSCRKVAKHSHVFFADVTSGCQVFYVCYGGGFGEAMLCPNGTLFNQEHLVCDWWYNVQCGM